MAKLHATCVHFGSGGAFQLGVYRRDVAAPAPWTRLDEANEPLTRQAYAIQIGDTIRNAYLQVGTQEIGIIDFDMNTGLWSTSPVTGGPIHSDGNSGRMAAAELPNGNILVAYAEGTNGAGGGGDLAYTIWDGASWSSPVVVQDLTGLFLYSSVKVLVESSGASPVLHFFYSLFVGFGSPQEIRHVGLDLDTMTLGAIQTPYTAPGTITNLNVSMAVYWPEAGKIVAALKYYYTSGSTNSRIPGIIIADSGDPAPTWSVESQTPDTDHAPSTGSAQLLNTHVLVVAGVLGLIWQIRDDISVDWGDIGYRLRQTDGTWDTADTIFFDYDADGPTPFPSTVDILYGFMNILSCAVPWPENPHGFAVLASYSIDEAVVTTGGMGYQTIACFLQPGQCTILNQALDIYENIPVSPMQGMCQLFFGGADARRNYANLGGFFARN